MIFSPRLRSILFIVNMSVMLLPLGGLTFLRVYETEMIRQKEGSLHSQGAYLSSMFRREYADKIHINDDTSATDSELAAIGLPLPEKFASGLFPYSTNLSVSAELKVLERHMRDPHRSYLTSLYPPELSAGSAGETLLPVILRAQNLNMDQVWIVDHFGTVVASSLGEEGRSIVSWEETQRALQGESVSLLRRAKPLQKRRLPLDIILGLGEPHLVYVGIPTIIGNRIVGAVIMSGTPSQITQFLYGNKGKLLNAFALLLLVVTLITVLSSLTISEPIQSLIKQTELIQKGHPEGSKPVRWPILLEMKQLSIALANMAKTITERSDYITAFARNVSHEFKTPLTGMRGTVELLKDEWPQMSDGDRKNFLSNLDRDTKRLSNLVSGLLAFARAEVAQPASSPINIANALEDIILQYSKQPIKIGLTIPTEPLFSKITNDLFESIVKNLLNNVIAHCPENSVVSITLNKLEKDQIEIKFEDNGPGISPANLEKIRSPFFTTSRESGGTGLGLSIVNAIVKGHGGNLAINSSLGSGTTVTITVSKD